MLRSASTLGDSILLIIALCFHSTIARWYLFYSPDSPPNALQFGYKRLFVPK
jgi:hypothetical protein